jgi:hypothetical protein
MRKLFVRLLPPLSLLLLLVSCADKYQEGLEEGQRIGKEEGYKVG